MFHKDSQRGGTQWSPPARIIGQEGQKNLWLLCGNVPLLLVAQNVRPATASEALALTILHGDPIAPGEIVEGTNQQSFLDARMRGHEEVNDEPPQPTAEGPSYAPERLPPVPEEDSDIWQISPKIFGEIPDGEEEKDDINEDAGDLGEAPSSAASRGTARRRPASSAAGPSPRAVRPRTGEPESKPSRDSRRSSSEIPASWSNVTNNLDDLPFSIRQHLERAS